MILVTGATGMFGSGVTDRLAERGVPVRAMTSSATHAQQMARPGVEPVVADMDRPETLGEAMAGVDTVFVVTPMDDRVQARERNVLEAAKREGVRRIVKLYGAVEHHGDDLGSLHDASVEAIRESGLQWALLSPTSVLETSLLSMIPWIEATGSVVACAGDGKVAHVAADDVARAGAAVLAERDENGRNYVITGPELLSLGELCEILSRVTDRPVPYVDVSDEQLTQLLTEQAGMGAEQAEIGVVCHFRAWRNGDARAHTDTFRELTGLSPTTVEQWIEAHRETFAQARDRAPAAA
ncbi:MAG TPA: NmrA family NAD(P)-binding protein [Solirubrobacteraceae bacterium]|nr:NmrA family NAD(P)-binding protein [Solirubrobacteraceae bacterium]